jgi:rSAM/selenodomain-associated transferase 2
MVRASIDVYGNRRFMSVSVIIPTLNEESCLEQTLRELRLQKPHEIIVADGGSSDATCRLAAEADLLVHASPGRAVQMNAGASRATGDVLLFLHADCRLETGALSAAEACMQRRGVAAGCFRMSVGADGLLFRCIDSAADLRVKTAGLIYGDQGLFLRRERFARLGGFPELQLMEDVFFSARLSRLGRLVIAPRRIYVSPRRWRKDGIVRQTVRNWALLSLVAAGLHPDRLARWYAVVR